MTTTFAKKCYNTASAEYAQLQSVRRDYPTFNVTTRKIKSNPNKETYAGLTYEYMREYTPQQLQLGLSLLEQGKTYSQITAMTGISKSTLIRAKRI